QGGRWATKRLVDAGGYRCARGAACVFAEGGLGGIIEPGADWHYDHTDDGHGYLGASHKICNLRAAGLKSGGDGAKKLPAHRDPRWADDPDAHRFYGPVQEFTGEPIRWSRAWWDWRREAAEAEEHGS